LVAKKRQKSLDSFVDKIPKTSSSKIMRRPVKAIITGRPLGDYSTMEDVTAMGKIKKAVEERKRET
jgi:hypothetical protein